MIVKDADCADSENVRDVHGGIPSLGIHLLIQAFSVFRVPATTILTVHAFPRILLPLALVSAIASSSFGQTETKPVTPRSDSPNKISVELQGRDFIIRDAGGEQRISSQNSTSRPPRIVYRKDANYAVWDSRGLSVRKGERVASTHLVDVVLSPKLFSGDEISQTEGLLEAGSRTKQASALSGSIRIENKVYFLPRWEQSDHSTWLEALEEVDLSGDSLSPKLEGKFSGITMAKKRIDNQLFVEGGRIAAITTRSSGEWGLAAYDPNTGAFDFKPLGVNLVGAWKTGKVILAVERTDYGTKTISRVDPSSGNRQIVGEFSGEATLVCDAPFILRISSRSGEILRNVDTAAELRIQRTTGVACGGKYVVIWPRKSLNGAIVYEPTDWTRVASLKAASSRRIGLAAPPSRSGSRPVRRVKIPDHRKK